MLLCNGHARDSIQSWTPQFVPMQQLTITRSTQKYKPGAPESNQQICTEVVKIYCMYTLLLSKPMYAFFLLQTLTLRTERPPSSAWSTPAPSVWAGLCRGFLAWSPRGGRAGGGGRPTGFLCSSVTLQHTGSNTSATCQSHKGPYPCSKCFNAE